jgi:hypothetical protein
MKNQLNNKKDYKDTSSQRIWTPTGPILVDQNGNKIEESKDQKKTVNYDAGKEEEYNEIPVGLM